MTAAARFLLLLLLWLVLAGASWWTLPVGAAAAGLGCWASLKLLPPVAAHVRPVALARLLVRFPARAVLAGMQVARLALDPRARVEPGYVTWTPRLPPGPMRDAFLAYVSLLPGTLPAGETAGGAVVVHALAGGEGVAAAMAEEEACFMAAFGRDG